MRYTVEVIADSTGLWVGNGMKFDGVAEAEAYARDLFSRWSAVQQWRVIYTTDFGTVVTVVRG